MTLRNRFWLLSLGFITLSALLSLVVVTTLFTPPVAAELVRLEEENRLCRLVHQLGDSDLETVERALREPENQGIVLSNEAGEVAVPLGNRYLVSERPHTAWEARKVVRPRPGRQFLALLSTLLFLYLLSTLLARYVLKPIQSLLTGVRALGEGADGVRVEVPPEAELAELATSFNTVAEQLSERESELKEALRAKELLFANTSHELRTPLTVIQGYCQMLEDGLKGELSEPQRETIQVIHRNSRYLLTQVETLLTLAQLRSKGLDFQREEADLRDLIHDLVEEFTGMAESKGLKLELELPKECVYVLLDYHRGGQIARNLLGNALKFTSLGGVTVEVGSREGVGEVLIRDTGLGVREDFRERLFEEFARGPDTEGVEGSGLGLALSRKLARSMGGDVRLVSSSETGTVFSWTVPLISETSTG